MVLIKTKKEMKTLALHKKVCAMYRELRKNHPHASMGRICQSIATEISISPVGVRNILIKRGEYEPNRDK